MVMNDNGDKLAQAVVWDIILMIIIMISYHIMEASLHIQLFALAFYFIL